MNLFSTTCGVITSEFEFIPRLEENFNWYPIDTPKGNILVGRDKSRLGVCYSLNGLDNVSSSERVIIDSNFWSKFADITSNTYYYFYSKDGGIFTLQRVPIINSGLDVGNIQSLELFPKYGIENEVDFGVCLLSEGNSYINSQLELDVDVCGGEYTPTVPPDIFVPLLMNNSVRNYFVEEPIDGNFSNGILIKDNFLYLYIDDKVHIINLDSFTQVDVQNTPRVANFYFNNKFYSFDIDFGSNEISVKESIDGFTWDIDSVFTISDSISISFWNTINLPNSFSCTASNYVYFLYNKLDSTYIPHKGLVRFDGITWENIESNFISVLPDNYLDIQCINSNSNILVLGTSFNKFLYSEDFGDTWNVVTVVPEWSNFNQIAKIFPGLFWTNYRDTSEYL